MNRLLVSSALLVAVAAPLAAQDAGRPRSLFSGRGSAVSVTPYAGYIDFGRLQAMPTGDQPLREGNWLVGAQAEVRMTPYLALAGNVGFARSPWTLASPSSGGVPSSGDLDYLLADANLQLQLPDALRPGGLPITPLLQGGLGLVRYSLDAGSGSQSNHDVQANVGGGLDVRLGGVTLRVLAKDYMTSLKWTDFRSFANVNGARPDEGRIAHNFAVTTGLRIDF